MPSNTINIDTRPPVNPSDSISRVSISSDASDNDLDARGGQRPPKKRRKKDDVWKHARKAILGVEAVREASGHSRRKVWYCKFTGCEQYKVLSSAAAKNHLKSIHRIDLNATTSPLNAPVQQDLRSVVSKQLSTTDDQQAQDVKEHLRLAANPAAIEQALLQLIVHHDLPLRTVEWPELHTLIHAINNQANKIIWRSHRTTANRITATFHHRRAELQQVLQSSRSLIHLTTDTWSSPNYKELQSVTAHFVSNEGRLCKALLALPELLNGHAGSEVAKVIIEVLDDYRVKDNLGYITADNATANDTLCSELGLLIEGWIPLQRRLRCLGHIINLAVQSFLFAKNGKAVSAALEYIDELRTAESHLIEQSEAEDGGGWIKQPALQKILHFAVTLRRSNRLFNAFRMEAGKSLRRPNDTRWNSYLNTFEDAFQLRATYTSFVVARPSLHEYELTAAD